PASIQPSSSVQRSVRQEKKTPVTQRDTRAGAATKTLPKPVQLPVTVAAPPRIDPPVTNPVRQEAVPPQSQVVTTAPVVTPPKQEIPPPAPAATAADIAPAVEAYARA